jgi:subfamily B ATP-binding cassette protein MsbA
MGEGFDTVLGDRGVRLSGGQRQRIAIARALLRDPDLLILDEATSALDSISERAVQASLEALMKGRTVVAIAHRLSTIENADNIVVLESGRVVEQGTFLELTERKGQFWEYYSIQFQMSESD